MENYHFNAVAAESAEVRGAFIRKTYAHLAGALLAFVLLETVFLGMFRDVAISFAGWALNGFNWLIVIGLFAGGSWVAEKWANSSVENKTSQYMGLGLYVLLETLIFAPLLVIATAMSGADSLILSAATISVGLFCGLTLMVFMTGTDFSFLRGALIVGSVVAVAVIIASIFIGFNLGLIFSAVMVLLAAGTILYQTSNIIYRYHSSQYVAASLGLFSSFMLLFWYVLRILMSLRD